MGSKTEYISVAGLRIDGRRPSEVRRIRSRFGLFSKVDGSAYLEQGNTKVVAVVYGPREVSRRGSSYHDRAVINCEYSQAPFATTERRVQRQGDRKKIEFSLALKQTFEAAIMCHLFPRTQIDIFVEVLQADGGQLAASINATTLALIDAGIAMKDFVLSCTAGHIQKTLVTDLNYTEEGANCPDLVVAMMPKTNTLNLVQMECKLPLEEFESLLESAMDGCRQIYEVLQNEVQEHAMQRLMSSGTYSA